MGKPTEPGRWLDYVLRGGTSFEPFWKSFLSAASRDLLVVVGRGFDPRMANAVSTIVSLGGDGRRDCILVEYDEGEHSPSRAHDPAVAKNVGVLEELFKNSGNLITKQIRMRSEDGRRRVGSRSAAGVFASSGDIEAYTDILVDISALPRSIYMPMLARLLTLVDSMPDAKRPNLHVVVGDNPKLDELIVAEGLSDDASYLHGFESGIEQEATAEIPKIWMPILGEGKIGHFERINDLIGPNEIAPILPFPCRNPRRTDDLILEYRAYLFDVLRIEPTNFIYVPEQNPFGVYREVISAILHYTDALGTLGGCKIVISALSSKLLSLGALLAAYDLKQVGYPVGIAHVYADGYTIAGEDAWGRTSEELFEVWIAGQPYALP